MPAPDRRRTRRVPASIPVELRDAKGFSLHACRDLSTGGAFFDRSIPHPLGERVQVTFTLPGETTPIRCDGEVVNVPDRRQFGMGVRFLNLAETDRVLLEQFTLHAGDP